MKWRYEKKIWKNLGFKGNLTMPFVMTRCNALSIKQIKPTEEQSIVRECTMNVDQDVGAN